MTETYREKLPDQCPPDEAVEVAGEMSVYRLVKADPPTGDDFASHRALQPDRQFHVSECIARGLSVWSDAVTAGNQRKLPVLKQTLVCKVRLGPGAGKTLQKDQTKHYTWWPYRDYDILAQCQVVRT